MNQIIIYNILSILVFAFAANNTNETSIRSSLRPAASMVDHIRLEIITKFVHLWRDFHHQLTPLSHVLDLERSRELLREFEEIDKKIKQAEEFTDLSDFFIFASCWSYVLTDGEIAKLNKLYETFEKFQKDNLHKENQPQSAWEDLANGFIRNSDSAIFKSLNKIRRYATSTIESENVFTIILQESQINICNLKQSPHQTLYNLYNTIVIAELKANAMLQFSYMLLKLHNKGDFKTEANLAMSSHENYARRKLRILEHVLSEADRSIYKCDPKQFIEGVTYTRITNLLQGYIENEVNLNLEGSCLQDCKYYKYTEFYDCFKNKFCANQPQCKGKVINCRYVHSDMTICTSSNPTRRYDWVEYKNEKTLGNKGFCEKKNLFQVDSWWRFLFVHCTYCLCLCDEGNQGSDRFFNLRDVTSDIQKNKVVTGVRIVKQNHIIHLQIQEGVLAPRGSIDKSTLAWKPVDQYSVTDRYVRNGVDYHTLDWIDRAIDLDDTFGPPEHVVTGLRFRKIGSHLNLEIRVTPINFTTGEVFQEQQSYWMGNDNTAVSKNPRAEITLTEPDIPIRRGPHILYSQSNQYIQFQPTSFTTDVGQSTVPYLDSQALTSQGFALSGIGLIYRGKPGSGGFISPKLISYNFAPHLHYY